jgi:hypothetical protein
VIGTADEVLVELLCELEELCLDADDEMAVATMRRRVLAAAVTAKTRLEKVRLGVVAA